MLHAAVLQCCMGCTYAHRIGATVFSQVVQSMREVVVSELADAHLEAQINATASVAVKQVSQRMGSILVLTWGTLSTHRCRSGWGRSLPSSRTRR